MLQTHDYVEPDFNLGKNVRCLMLTREFLKEKTRGPSNFLGKVTGKPVQLMEQVHGVKIKTVSNCLDEPLEGTDGIYTKSRDFALGVKTATVFLWLLVRKTGLRLLFCTLAGRGCAAA